MSFSRILEAAERQTNHRTQFTYKIVRKIGGATSGQDYNDAYAKISLYFNYYYSRYKMYTTQVDLPYFDISDFVFDITEIDASYVSGKCYKYFMVLLRNTRENCVPIIDQIRKYFFSDVCIKVARGRSCVFIRNPAFNLDFFDS